LALTSQIVAVVASEDFVNIKNGDAGLAQLNAPLDTSLKENLNGILTAAVNIRLAYDGM